jgi:alpha,alpha-trehalase
MSRTVSAEHFDAVILEVDGVVTDTARLRLQSWRHVFADALTERGVRPGEDNRPMSDEDFQSFVVGRSSYQGTAALLASRGIVLSRGTPGDPESADTVCGLGNRLDQQFVEVVRHRGVRVFAGTVTFVRACRSAGLATAVILAGRNDSVVLAAAGLESLFDLELDASITAHPALAKDEGAVAEAARRLSVAPGRAIAVAASQAGVAAARRAGFALVLGIDRGGECSGLLTDLADLVVTDLNEVGVVGPVDRSQLLS